VEADISTSLRWALAVIHKEERMKYFGAILCFTMAALGAFGAIKGEAFYAGRLGRRPTKQIPSWFGRLWFLVFSACAAYMGIRGLLSLHH
jgi:hypothetical protein